MFRTETDSSLFRFWESPLLGCPPEHDYPCEGFAEELTKLRSMMRGS